MKFFIPAAKDKETESSVYEGIKKHAKDIVGWDIEERRIYRIKYEHGGKRYVATVGETDERVREPVIAILESTGTFLVCTPNQGVVRDMPVLVGKQEIIKVTDFDS